MVSEKSAGGRPALAIVLATRVRTEEEDVDRKNSPTHPRAHWLID